MTTCACEAVCRLAIVLQTTTTDASDHYKSAPYTTCRRASNTMSLLWQSVPQRLHSQSKVRHPK